MGKAYDKILFVLALILAVLSVGYFFFVDDAVTTVPQVTVADNPWQQVEVERQDVVLKNWEKPAPQTPIVEETASTDEQAWTMEVFTPSIIYFQPPNNWTVLEEKPPPPVVPVEVVDVGQKLYRLQYSSHVGAPGDFFVTLRDPSTGRDISIRQGRTNEEHQFTLKDMSEETIRTVEVNTNERGEEVEDVYFHKKITAVIQDHKLDKEVTLTEEPKFNDYAVAKIRRKDGSESWEVREGEEIAFGDTQITINALSTDPKSVTMTILSPQNRFKEPTRIRLAPNAGAGPLEEEADNGQTPPNLPPAPSENNDNPYVPDDLPF